MTSTTRVTFLLSKDPQTEHGGDLTLSKLVMRLAAEQFDVDALCLSSTTGPQPAFEFPLRRVAKPAVDPVRVAATSVRRRRSLVHVRFDVDDMVAAIEDSRSDVFFAEHSYMAESFLRSQCFGTSRFVINTVNSEADVWRSTRGLLGRIETPRLQADELRVARAADAVGTYDADEAVTYRNNGVTSARWIDLTMPPVQRLDLSETRKRLVFMGTRDWPPNQEAFLEALRLWPRVSAGIPDAELVIVGARKAGEPDPVYPEGVRDLGFVDQLPELLATCRALMAPVRTGGGVRVKLLDAARMGLPVIGSTEAIGSVGPLFGVSPFDSDDAFVDECRRYLLDGAAATADGERIYERNAEHWAARRPHQAINDLVTTAVTTG